MLKNRSMLLVVMMTAATTAHALPVTPGIYGGDAPGNDGNCIPLCSGAGNRYQQIYDGAAFSGFSGVINSFAFRLDEADEAFAGLPWDPPVPNASFTDLRVDLNVTLAYTGVSPLSISPVFAHNVAIDARQVFSGSVYWSASQAPGSSPNAFDLLVDVEDSFFYDGVQNLLLDITILNQADIEAQLGGRRYLDAAWRTAPFGRAYGPADGTEGGFNASYGLITQFDLQPPTQVPEPSSMALLLCGIGMTWLARRRSRA